MTDFLKDLARCSAKPLLEEKIDMQRAEVLGMGNYGYVISSYTPEGKRVVVKLQGERWAGVAAREWTAAAACHHSNIVEYMEVIMHKDTNHLLRKYLTKMFDIGTLSGKRPKQFPMNWFCMSLEFMDRGTAQGLQDKSLVTPESAGAMTRQVASALQFMHEHQMTHNDIKPENVLLRVADKGGFLVAKLADLGLAAHSRERNRDFDLFAYTVWCLGLGRRFASCHQGKDKETAIGTFKKSPEANAKPEVWEALLAVVTGMYKNEMAMKEVANWPELKGLEVRVPSTEEVTKALEAASKEDVRRRTVAATKRNTATGGALNLEMLQKLQENADIASEPESVDEDEA
jgi:serine/threonine protein kinase